MTWVVSGPLAVVKVGGHSVRLDRGAAVPEDAENVDHLLSVGLIVEVPGPQPEPEPEGDLLEQPEPTKRSSRPRKS